LPINRLIGNARAAAQQLSRHTDLIGQSVPHAALIFAAATHTMNGNHDGSPAEAAARHPAPAPRSESKPAA
jgi:hypothetical protein